ncbi:MAG: pitrilysin family protein [Gemmatimonadaceae bacterium]
MFRDVVRHRLANGLTVLLRHDPSAPVAAVVTYVRAGYFDETDDIVGIAHVLEHMYFKGTPSRAVGEIARETKAQGGYLNAGTIYDHTSYYAVVPSEGFARALEVQADAYANSSIDAGELARELEVIIEEAKRKADTPEAVTTETLFELLHDVHRIRRWRIGREDGLRQLTRDHLLHFYRNLYRPSTTVLSIVGDLDLDVVLKDVERLYGQLPAGEPQRSVGPHETSPPGFRYRELASDIAQAEIAFGWRTPGTRHADTPALDMAALVLGTGRASRLYRAVRERELAASVSAYNYTPTELGVFVLHAEGDPARTGQAAAAMWNEVTRLQQEPIPAGELERARRVHESRWLRRLETMDGQANVLAEWESLGGWELADEYFDRSMRVTATELREAVRTHLVADDAGMLVHRPRTSAPVASTAEEARSLLPTTTVAPSGAWSLTIDAPAVQVRPTPPTQVVGAVRVYRHEGTGLPILVRVKPGAAVSHVGVFALGGAAAEPARVAGVATLSGRVALKGTERRSAAQVAEASELLGGSISPSVSSDGLGFTLSVPTPRIALAIELLADVVQAPRLDAADIETERTIMLSQLAQLRDDMFRYPVRLATQAAFGTHPYARGTIGSEDSVRAISASDVVAWLRERPAAWVVGVVADGDPDVLAAEAVSRFGALRLTDPPEILRPEWPDEPLVQVETRDKAQSALALLFPGPSHRDPTRFAARLIAAVTSGLGGRFFDQLRDRQSLCYTVHASPTERVAAGLFSAYIATSPEKEDVAREGLLREFEKLVESPVTAEELDRAQRYVSGTHAIAQQHGGTQLAEMVDAWLFGEGLEELQRYDDRVWAQTPEDLQRVAQRYFHRERHVEGIVRGTGRKV